MGASVGTGSVGIVGIAVIIARVVGRGIGASGVGAPVCAAGSVGIVAIITTSYGRVVGRVVGRGVGAGVGASVGTGSVGIV